MSTFTLGTCEFSKKNKNHLLRSTAAEFVGTFLLNFFTAAACTQAKGDLVLISLAFGCVVLGAMSTLGHIGGCHINPTVTISFLFIGKVSVVRGIFYIVAQFTGATAAIISLKVLIQNVEGTETLGHAVLNDNISPFQGFAIEFSLGFILLFVICGVSDDNKPDSRFAAPLAVSLTVTLCHLAFVPYTGASMSASGSFATALVLGLWENHWVYWAGPILGGIVGSLLYTNLFAAVKAEEIEKFHQVQHLEIEVMQK